jgi:thioester reductase-like protein
MNIANIHERNNNKVRSFTETELKVINIVKQYVTATEVGVYDDFFSLGGKSIHVVSLLEHFDNISVYEFYTNPTVSFLCTKYKTRSWKHEIDKLELKKSIGCIPDQEYYFITGGGFIVCHLIQEILKVKPHAHVVCMLRNRAKYEQLCLLEQTNSRFSIIEGDLLKVNMGLHFETLPNITHIIHAAAHVDHLKPSSVMYETNVLGTLEVMKLFSFFPSAKLILLSTVAVTMFNKKHLFFAKSIRFHKPNYLNVERYQSSGYACTKAEAEAVVQYMCEKNPILLKNTTILRLGRIGAHSVSGQWENENDFHNMLLQAVKELGTAPRLSWAYTDNTPVDKICSQIVNWKHTPGRIHFVHSFMKPTRWYYPSGVVIMEDEKWIQTELIRLRNKDLKQRIGIYNSFMSQRNNLQDENKK